MLARAPLFAVLVAAVPALADNFVNNPGFDSDVDHWGGPPIVWIAEDELGDPASGSAYVEVPGHSSAHLTSDCFPVGGGQQLVFGASANLEGSEPLWARVGVELRFYDQPNCAGSATLTPYPSLIAESAYAGWGSSQANAVAPAGAQSAQLLILLGSDGANSQVFRIDNAFVTGGTCAAGDRVLCLENERFRVSARWRIPDGTRGYAGVRPLSADSGFLWFFDVSNLELVIKVLDGCGSNERFWIFAAGLTNLGVELDVTDTFTGEVWRFENPVDDAFPPRQDIEAFDTCDAGSVVH